MPDPLLIHDLKGELLEREQPMVTTWNRLEGRPRSVDFTRALRAEVRDALWMLTRQWQLGELHGDDAGSPVLAKVQLSQAELVGFQARDAAPAAIDPAIPLEAVVERRPLDILRAAGAGAIDLRLVIGRRFMKSVPSPYRAALIAQWGFAPPDPDDPADTDRVAHLEVWATLRSIAGRALDGYRLYEHLVAAPGNTPWGTVPVLDADKPALVDAGKRLVAWVDAMFQRPGAASAWDPLHLEHRFAVTAAVDDGEKRLVADEYPGGRLDWTSFSIDPAGAKGSGKWTAPICVIPTNARFDGMPDPRWWAFEDGRTNLGDVRADTTDLARLLFMEFALTYSNDWFTIPVELAVGRLAKVEGLVVTNVFGERLWITAAGRGLDDDWNRWSMFGLDIRGTAPAPADTSLFLPATVPHQSESMPLEDVMFMRDEVANLVWGIERIVALATGVGRRGAEVAAEALAHRRRLASPGGASAAPEAAAAVSYRVMTSVPEHWIPFVPMHVDGDVRETQLQRAAMPRLLEGLTTVDRVRPRTSLLRHGLDLPTAQPYFVAEEEVPRAGTQVSISYQRTRWRDGATIIWLAARRQTGRGEESSGLAFDQLVPTPPASIG
jgi:hypothetical protein